MTQQTTATALATLIPPAVTIEDPADAPLKSMSGTQLQLLGQRLNRVWTQYQSDRRLVELRWLRNQRQYLGIYDPDTEKELSANRSKAYPRITRVKCISVASRLMNLMFPGNERNWELKAAPAPTLTKEDVQQAVQAAIVKDQAAQVQPTVDKDYVKAALQQYMDERASTLTTLIDDQLQEIGGDQTYDFIALNREVIQSGVLYGPGVLLGPYAREVDTVQWDVDPQQNVTTKKTKRYMPMFEFMPVWDFYPDMSAKNFDSMDGWFMRKVLTRHGLRKLADREGFFPDVIKKYLSTHAEGNYRPLLHEMELKAMGIKAHVNEQKVESTKYEVLVWHGPLSGEFLRQCGLEIKDTRLSEELDAEIWMIDGNIISAQINPWAELKVDVKTLHPFLFDEDDTSPVGFGLPNAIRDSQMMVAAATRMLLDNASVVCGPNLELNVDLLTADTDLAAISAYKVWKREGTGPEGQWPAVRNVQIDAHLDSLLKIVDLGMKFADAETFVGPATGGDMAQAPSEPMRTAAGASMMRGDAALPFKDIVRAFDRFTTSVIMSLVQFNRVLNPNLAPDGDYDVIARGATSLIAKEVRGMQADQLAQTLTPAEIDEIDARKLLKARLSARDMDDVMVSEVESDRRQAQKAQQAQQAQQQQQQQLEATIRKLLSDAYKNVAQGQKNTAMADAATVDAALTLMERGLSNGAFGSQNPNGGAGPQPISGQGNPANGGPAQVADAQIGGGQGPVGPGQAGGVPVAPGGGAGLGEAV